jgi:hypothetical protein
VVAGAASPLLTAPIGSTILRLAAPNMIAMVVTMVTLMAEARFVGQLDTEALAGLALGFPMMMLSGGSFGLPQRPAGRRPLLRLFRPGALPVLRLAGCRAHGVAGDRQRGAGAGDRLRLRAILP